MPNKSTQWVSGPARPSHLIDLTSDSVFVSTVSTYTPQSYIRTEERSGFCYHQRALGSILKKSRSLSGFKCVFSCTIYSSEECVISRYFLTVSSMPTP
nr:uncharacterized protein LOC112427689 isoform X2 [Macaca nemestrina]